MDPPVPIPNTEVKRHSAHDTAPARVWENRSPPGDYFDENAHSNVSVFLFNVLNFDNCFQDLGKANFDSSEYVFIDILRALKFSFLLM